MLSLNPRLVALFAGAYAAGTVLGKALGESINKKYPVKYTFLGEFSENNKGGEL